MIGTWILTIAMVAPCANRYSCAPEIMSWHGIQTRDECEALAVAKRRALSVLFEERTGSGARHVCVQVKEQR